MANFGSTTGSFEDRVGQVLLEGGFINYGQLEHARQKLKEGNNYSLLDTLVVEQMLSPETLVTVLSFQLKIPVVELRYLKVDPEAAKLLSGEYARQY